MCKFASFVLTKDRELWLPNNDRHEDIIDHFKLHADGARGPNVVRVEIVPGPHITRWDDYAGWVFRFDQDTFPAWHDPAETEVRARAALLRRAAEGFETVYARGCAALTKLDAPEATCVDARGCVALTKLDAPKAQAVYADGCAALTKLDAPEATYVDARGCAALTKPKIKGRIIS